MLIAVNSFVRSSDVNMFYGLKQNDTHVSSLTFNSFFVNDLFPQNQCEEEISSTFIPVGRSHQSPLLHMLLDVNGSLIKILVAVYELTTRGT